MEVNNLTNDFLTSSGGLVIGEKIANSIRDNPTEQIEVSFEYVECIAPAFINGAFLFVIDLYGETIFKDCVCVRKASKKVASEIRNSVTKYIEYRNRKIG